MTAIMFGAQCDRTRRDGKRCLHAHGDYGIGCILTCEDCGLDLCEGCRTATGHSVEGEVCCSECRGPRARCPEDAQNGRQDAAGADLIPEPPTTGPGAPRCTEVG